jgi:4-hydroxyphenylpyruvate dioxygenase
MTDLSTHAPLAVADSAGGGRVQLRGIDYVEFYVGNAYQAAHFYRTVLGFRPVAYAGLETGSRDRTSYLMEQGQVRFLLTSAHEPRTPLAEHVHLHGDGVKDVAFRVDDVAEAFGIAVERGAKPVLEPTVFDGPDGRVVKASIGVFGDTIHSLVERAGYAPGHFPQYQRIVNAPSTTPIGIEGVDHIAVSMEEGTLDEWVEFYTNVLGFHQSHEEMVWTEKSAMNSKVVEDSSGSIKLPIVEPVSRGGRSQVQEYLAYNHGAGTQHVALETGDILSSVRAARTNGMEFLSIPDTYYEALQGRVGDLSPELATGVHETGVLVDRDDNGILLQTFTRPLQTRPTLFLELIERRGATGFGGGNIRALFEAIEREQAKRGNV